MVKPDRLMESLTVIEKLYLDFDKLFPAAVSQTCFNYPKLPQQTLSCVFFEARNEEIVDVFHRKRNIFYCFLLFRYYKNNRYVKRRCGTI